MFHNKLPTTAKYAVYVNNYRKHPEGNTNLSINVATIGSNRTDDPLIDLLSTDGVRNIVRWFYGCMRYAGNVSKHPKAQSLQYGNDTLEIALNL